MIKLRAALGDSQQQFANRLQTAVTTVARYETSRPPSGTALADLARLASDIGRGDLVFEFLSALGREMNFRQIKGGVISIDAASREPRGYLLAHVQGARARHYARGFFEALNHFYNGTDEDKADAQRMLDHFADAAQRRFPAIGTMGWA